MAPSIWSVARKTESRPSGANDRRTPFEQDYDRILFSTPVRRLADKTQVFPLEKNDSVRTRLTHSHEVSNLARSIGNRLLRTDASVFGDDPDVKLAVPVILAAIGLAHDLGNPPFGHKGEAAIREWFSKNAAIFDEERADALDKIDGISNSEKQDFLLFEGNAQTIRIVSKLQSTSGPAGLNLTATTISSLMKYTVNSSGIDDKYASSSKFGYFLSETDIIEWIREKTGLEEKQRHPLTWLMEACDDTAYSILDVEDAIKKELVSAEDLRAFIGNKFRSTTAGGGLVNQLEDDFKKADGASADLDRVSDVKTSYIRTRLVEAVLTGAADEFVRDRSNIFNYSRPNALLKCGTFSSDLTEAMKDFAKTHAYNSSGVLRNELQGTLVIQRLMDRMWSAITKRTKVIKPSSKRVSAVDAYVYSRISSSYRWIFENASDNSRENIRYREAQLLTDMISGMTDRFAVELDAEIRAAENA